MGDNENDAIDLEHSNGWLAFEMLGTLLEEEEFHPEQLSGTTAYRFGVSGTNGQFRVVAHCNVELEQLYVYVLTDVRVPEPRRGAVAELIARANYGMRIGNFELDMRDGEVRYKSSLDFEHNELTPSLVHNAMMPALATMDRYFAVVMSVAFGSVSPADAITVLEPAPQVPADEFPAEGFDEEDFDDEDFDDDELLDEEFPEFELGEADVSDDASTDPAEDDHPAED
ncbi:MAG: YbjN domain-containing protein [Microthrixaceae bacterium]